MGGYMQPTRNTPQKVPPNTPPHHQNALTRYFTISHDITNHLAHYRTPLYNRRTRQFAPFVVDGSRSFAPP